MVQVSSLFQSDINSTTSTMKGKKGEHKGKPRSWWSLVALLVSVFVGTVLGAFLFSLRPKQIPPDHDLVRFRTQCKPPVEASQVLPTILANVYGGVSPYASFPDARYTELVGRVGTQGWGSTNLVFEDLIKSVRPKTIIEVGSFLGASAIHMANLTEQFGLWSTSIICIDDFRGWVGFRRDHLSDIQDVNGDVMLMYEFMWNVMSAGKKERVLAMPFSSAVALEALCDMGVYGDLVEVDAGHDFHSAWVDINRAWMITKTGGVLFGHDYDLVLDDFGVRRAVQLFAKLKGLEVTQHGQHWVLYPPKGP